MSRAEGEGNHTSEGCMTKLLFLSCVGYSYVVFCQEGEEVHLITPVSSLLKVAPSLPLSYDLRFLNLYSCERHTGSSSLGTVTLKIVKMFDFNNFDRLYPSKNRFTCGHDS
jgi:hypothetical protein